MLKKIIGLVAVAALSLHFGTASADAAKFIGEAKAREIALAHAQVSPQVAYFKKVKLDREFLYTKYELEFMVDGVEYEYDINAESGQILKFSREEKYGGKRRGAGAPQGGMIGADRARQIALARVPGATESHIRKFKLDYEHGIQVYEGEIIYNMREYEFKIDAATGEIVEWELD